METPQGKQVCRVDRNPAMWGQYRHKRTKERFENWCNGMTQRDDMGRVVGGVFRVGNSCIPVVDSCQ